VDSVDLCGSRWRGKACGNAPADKINVFCGELGVSLTFPVGESSMATFVGFVFGVTTPYEILGMIVPPIAVQVSNDTSVRRGRSVKCRTDERVHRSTAPILARESYPLVAITPNSPD
jgi:hypothetical protein